MSYMKNLRKVTCLTFFVSLLFVSGCCLFGPSDPDVIVLRSAFIPDEWEENVLARLNHGTDCRRIKVAEARQMNDYGHGRVHPGNEMFAVVAAYNKESGRLVARWGYSPHPQSGENGLEVTITNLMTSIVGPSSAKHPVGFRLTPDFSSLTMSWGPRIDKNGTLMHTVMWNAVKPD